MDVARQPSFRYSLLCEEIYEIAHERTQTFLATHDDATPEEIEEAITVIVDDLTPPASSTRQLLELAMQGEEVMRRPLPEFFFVGCNCGCPRPTLGDLLRESYVIELKIDLLYAAGVLDDLLDDDDEETPESPASEPPRLRGATATPAERQAENLLRSIETRPDTAPVVGLIASPRAAGSRVIELSTPGRDGSAPPHLIHSNDGHQETAAPPGRAKPTTARRPAPAAAERSGRTDTKATATPATTASAPAERPRRRPVIRPTITSELLENPARLGAAPYLRQVKANCPDCSAPTGTAHLPGCDVERCSVCGQQRLRCVFETGGCAGHDGLAEAWSGEWPGADECRRRGWYAVRAEIGWRPCARDTPCAIPDLNRLEFFRAEGYDGLYRPELAPHSGCDWLRSPMWSRRLT